jgi:predicted dienelactone hydrolase
MSLFAGSRMLQIKDDANGLTFPAWVVYPTRSAAVPTRIGPYLVDVAPDAPIASGRFPIVVLSHGGGGSHLGYRTLVTHLAQNGFVVVMPEHVGNNRNDNRLGESVDNLRFRPRHFRLTIDTVIAHPELGPALDRSRVVAVGHSMGGYTALAAAGGIPWTRSGEQLTVETDPRLKALVLFTPGTDWFIPPDSLRAVSLPMLVYAGEADDFTPPHVAERVLSRVPDRNQVTFRIVPRAGHFSFLSPFPPEMHKPGFAPATDPAGFDRVAFQEQLKAEVLAFLQSVFRPAV